MAFAVYASTFFTLSFSFLFDYVFYFAFSVNSFSQLSVGCNLICFRMVRTYAKLHKSMEILEYFTTRSWEWMHGHLDTLKSQMSPEDQKVCNKKKKKKNPTTV